MRRQLLAALSTVPLLLAGIVLTSPGATASADPQLEAPPPQYTDGVYVVQMVEPPAAAYTGGKAGLRATKPKAGQRLDSRSARVTAYTRHLRSAQSSVLSRVGSPRTLYRYTYAYNGFAAKLTADQAAQLAKAKGVLTLTKQRLYSVDTSSTPSFLGLDARDGLWNMLGGTRRAGEGVVVGIIDSGIWPDSLSFTDRVDRRGVPSATGRPVFAPIPGWHGTCQTGEDFDASDCNGKLIGARYFNAGQGGDAGIDADRPWEFNSPRDYNGHGSHTAGTAGGNYKTPTTGPSQGLGSSLSGMAPRARIAAYKALWSTESGSTASGATADLVAAIDQAVADGVDVINYSVSGSQTDFLDPVEVSFLFAADAGVFVSASAGNSGPTASTVAHPSPWITTVAAGTHNRNGQGSVTLGDGTSYAGASIAAQEVTAPVVNSTAVAAAGATADQARLCYSSSDGILALDPALVAGKIVVCERGTTARTNKSLAVQEAGGVGMILVNTSTNSLNADFHFVPTVHLQADSRAAVEAYAATAGATATIAKGTLSFTDPAPFTASFSSRGPLRAGGGDVLKPDLMAPGQDIVAAVAPTLANHGLDFNLYSGTSMSAPHVAGIAALLQDLHPRWSPMAVKSALMTSAYDVLDGDPNSPSVIFSQGAGHIQPNSAADPGLVYDSGWDDWLAFICGASPGALSTATCDSLVADGHSTDPSDVNTASIAIGDLAGTQTVTRRVTNVSHRPEVYKATVQGVAGVDVSVSPRWLFLRPGETRSFTVSFTRTDAPLNAYTGGYLTWESYRHSVRSPIAVKPVALGAPASVSGTGDPITYPVKFGYDGDFSATARGLVAAMTQDGTVADDPGNSFAPFGPGTTLHMVDIPAGTTYARISLFDDATDGNDDLDLYVFKPSGAFAAQSATGTSNEEVNLVNPAAGSYYVFVHGFATDGPDANYTLFSWALGSTAEGNMSVAAPATASLGSTGDITLTFSGLSPATRYLGAIDYAGTTGMPAATMVRVDTP